MRLPNFASSRTKTIVHALQAFMIFLGWVLTIAVFTRDGANDGRTIWYFIMCWISVPALIYLTAVPMWPRLRRFGNIYAFVLLDGIFALLWFTAWVAVASYVGSGKGKGKDGDDDKDNKDDKDKNEKGGCDAFAYGSPAKCKLSTGTVVLGVFICLIFVLTTYLSFRNMRQYRQSGTMPYDGSDPTFAAHSQAAFSSNPTHEFDEEDDRDTEFRTGRFPATQGSSSLSGRRDEDEYALLQQSELDDIGTHGGRPVPAYDPTANNNNNNNNNNISSTLNEFPPSQVPASGSTLHDYDTSYGGAYGGRQPSNEYGYNR
ncbi:hypothetical protein FQN57_001681 [Myotisia sp. PD_48]|nr:hypothetical protein FQN57_001681 [Myotisia sp. PD_48]